MATLWVPIAVGTGVPALALLCGWMLGGLRPGRRGPEPPDSGDDGGSHVPTPPPPPRLPPAGPVSWPEFERRFAEYVAACSETSATRGPRSPDDDRDASRT